MSAAVTELRIKRTGMVVQCFKALGGSPEVATVAADENGSGELCARAQERPRGHGVVRAEQKSTFRAKTCSCAEYIGVLDDVDGRLYIYIYIMYRWRLSGGRYTELARAVIGDETSSMLTPKTKKELFRIKKDQKRIKLINMWQLATMVILRIINWKS